MNVLTSFTALLFAANPVIAPITLTLRWIVVLLIIATAAVLWKFGEDIKDKFVTRLLLQLSSGFLGFALMRFFSSLLDSHFAFEIGIFSNVVNILQYLWFLWFILRTRKLVLGTKPDVAGTPIAVTLIRQVSAEMQEAAAELQAIQKKKKLSKHTSQADGLDIGNVSLAKLKL